MTHWRKGGRGGVWITAQLTAISVEIGSMTALQEATLNTLRAMNARLQILENPTN
jgi:hypothetical protein